MNGLHAELTIEDVLADPMILALRRADHVDPAAFETLLRAKSRVATPGPTQPAGEAAPHAERRAMPPAHLCARHLEAGRCSGSRGTRTSGSVRPW